MIVTHERPGNTPGPFFCCFILPSHQRSPNNAAISGRVSGRWDLLSQVWNSGPACMTKLFLKEHFMVCPRMEVCESPI
jgi:hypothetical protein